MSREVPKGAPRTELLSHPDKLGFWGRKKLNYKNRQEKLHNKLFPGEREKRDRYQPFIEQARTGVAVTLEDEGLRRLTTLWRADPPYVRRPVEEELREAARSSGQQIDKLRRRKHSSLGSVLNILGHGKHLPTTAAEAEARLRSENDAEKIKALNELREALEHDETTGGSHNRTVVWEIGLNASVPVAGTQMQVGIESQPNDNSRNPKPKRDVFVAVGGRALIWSRKGAKGRHKKGVEKTVTVGVVSRSTGHPYRGGKEDQQDKVRGGPLEVGAGKLNTFLFEPPPPALIALFLPKYAPMVHVIQSLGYAGWLKPQIALTTDDERFIKLQKKAAKISAAFPPIPERVKFWKKKQSDLTLEGEAEELLIKTGKKLSDPV